MSGPKYEPYNSYVAKDDCEIEGRKIKKGTKVSMLGALGAKRDDKPMVIIRFSPGDEVQLPGDKDTYELINKHFDFATK